MLMQCCGFDNRRATRYSFCSLLFSSLIVFVRFRSGGENVQGLASARAYDSRLSLPRVVEDTRLRLAWHLACIIYTSSYLCVAYDQRLSSAVKRARFKYYNFIARVCNRDRIFKFKCKVFLPSMHKRHDANAALSSRIGKRRKPKKFSSRCEIVTIFLPSYFFRLTLEEGRIFNSAPRVPLNARIGRGIRVFFSVWHLVLYISKLVFIYT